MTKVALCVLCGKRVLLVDTDPQGDLTKSLGWADPDSLEATIANHLSAVIEGEGADPREGILSHKEGIDLMPANIELAGMEMPVLMAMSREQLLNVWVSPLKGDYDFILFDCAPTATLVRSIMEEEKPNQIEQFKIPKRSIARFFEPSSPRRTRARATAAPRKPRSAPERENPYLGKPHLENRHL